MNQTNRHSHNHKLRQDIVTPTSGQQLLQKLVYIRVFHQIQLIFPIKMKMEVENNGNKNLWDNGIELQ